MTMMLVVTENHVDAESQVSHLSPCWCPRAMLQPGSYRPNAMRMSGPELQLRIMSGVVILLQPGSVYMPKAPVTMEGDGDA